MKKSKILSLFAAIFVVGASASHAAVLVEYDFGTVASPTLAPTTQESGIKGTPITPNTGTTVLRTTTTVANTPPAAGELPILDRPDGHTVQQTPPSIVGNNNFFSFTLTADIPSVPDATFNITDLQLDFGPGGSTNRGFVLAYALDGGDFTQIGSVTQLGGGATSTTFTNFLFAAPATNVKTAEFRFFTFANAATGRAMFFDNIIVNGAVPEPTTFAMLLGGFGTLLMLRRRRA